MKYIKYLLCFTLLAALPSTVYCQPGTAEPEAISGAPVAHTQDAATGATSDSVLVSGYAYTAEDETEKPLVYLFPIREDIMPATWRLTEKCLKEATELGADYVVIDMNTYGGLVDAADKIRTAILNYEKPVYVFINNQAASAGALISIAADSIYMRSGASIGAATVVDQSGEEVPDKYQSFMRGMMRATAEAHGKVVDYISSRGDTVWRWFRDPRIAEAMVDPTISVPGLIDSTKVLTLSTEEAIKWHFCEGRAQSIDEALALAGVPEYELAEYKPTALHGILGFLTNPAFQAILIMLMIGGIYFELQTPGVGFPLAVALLAATLYFAPLYLEGLLAHWELALFIVGVVLIILEIFVTPGFGVLGIVGILAVVLGLTFAMIDTDLLKYIPSGQIKIGYLLRPIGLVVISVTAAIIISIWMGKRLLTSESRLSKTVVLKDNMDAHKGYVSHANDRALVGRDGVTSTPLRPSGKVIIDNRIYEAAGENGQFIDLGEDVTVVRDEGGVLYCKTK